MTPSPEKLAEIRRELEKQELELAQLDQLARAYSHVQLHIAEEIESQMTSISSALTRMRPTTPATFAVRV